MGGFSQESKTRTTGHHIPLCMLRTVDTGTLQRQLARHVSKGNTFSSSEVYRHRTRGEQGSLSSNNLSWLGKSRGSILTLTTARFAEAKKVRILPYILLIYFHFETNPLLRISCCIILSSEFKSPTGSRPIKMCSTSTFFRNSDFPTESNKHVLWDFCCCCF